MTVPSWLVAITAFAGGSYLGAASALAVIVYADNVLDEHGVWRVTGAMLVGLLWLPLVAWDVLGAVIDAWRLGR